MLLLGASLDIAVEIDNVVKIARPGSLDQGPEFLGEGLDIIVGENLDAAGWLVSIGVEDFGCLGLCETTRSSAVRSSLIRGRGRVGETGPL